MSSTLNTDKQNYYCSASEVVNLIKTAPDYTPILVDFDETLFLRNSTEEYLNTLQPRALGAILLAFLSFLKPWYWLPSSVRSEEARDWVRVVVATLFFPWTPLLWQWRAKQLSYSYPNERLIQALKDSSNSQIIVATQGFDFIVRPIAKSLSLPVTKIIACRFWQGVIDRNKGKHLLVKAALGEDIIKRAIVVTDSTDDLPLLSLVPKPCLVIWPIAKYVPAMTDAYIPLFYLEKVKRPGQRYFAKVILGEELIFLLLGLSWLSPNPLLHGAAMVFLVLSFWCIYEIGYMENDLIAESFEKDPSLSEHYLRYKQRIDLWQPWIWAAILAIPGIVLLQFCEVAQSSFNFDLLALSKLNLRTIFIEIGCWFSLLFAVRVSFWCYNRLDKQTRTWVYPLLQVYKFFGFLSVTATNLIGTILFITLVLSRCIVYFVYRYAKTDWPKDINDLALRCLLFGFLIVAVAVGTHNFSQLFNWQTSIIFIYCAFRARHQLRKIAKIQWTLNLDTID
jgi:phosphoserine phosphatase